MTGDKIMNIIEILRDHARARPDEAAIIDARRGTFTFAELEKESSRAAALLNHAGIKPKDAVLVFCPVSAELYILLTALFRVGAVAMFLDPSAGRKHIEQCCSLVKPAALIATSKAHLLRLVSPALRRIPMKFSIGFPVLGAVSLSRAAKMTPDADIHTCDA
ncbi:MAG TPA: AMP-binding protein, partial [Blastocatellia bacterium]